MEYLSRLSRPVVAVAAALLAAACTPHAASPTKTEVGQSTGTSAEAATGIGAGDNVAATHPNIIFVLTDDLSWDLVAHMPAVQKMRNEGMTFTNFAATNTLCCPSRSSILTGKFPHNTKVFTNNREDGGFAVFHGRGEEKHTFATALQARGYRTGFMGKYLNGYTPSATLGGSKPYVPPGWNEWDVTGAGYKGFDYSLNESHTVVPYGHDAKDYLTDVLSRKGVEFVRQSAAARKPFLLEVATFSPHHPFTPAPQDENKFAGLKAPRDPSFNALPKHAPPWLAGRKPLTGKQITALDGRFRKRVQAVQSVDRMITSLRESVRQAGVADDTYVVFGSDNGFHIGQHGLMSGKQTAFETDVNVPLVVVGPSVPADSRSDANTANIDLAPTFQELGGAPVDAAVNGHSMTTLLKGKQGTAWRSTLLIEHRHSDNPADPDRQSKDAGDPPTYHAIRTSTFTYVEYGGGAREYYDRRNDPHQLVNAYGTLSADRRSDLHKAVAAQTNCHTGAECWSAGRPR